MITAFRIFDRDSLRLAECQNVPPVMIIAGPNGVGKSTLLYNLSGESVADYAQIEGSGTPPLYLPPHRPWEAQSFQLRDLISGDAMYSKVLEARELPDAPGLRIRSRSSTSFDADSASSFIKLGLARLEWRKKMALEAYASRFPIGQPWQPPSDPFEPHTNFVQFLFPHLEFNGINLPYSGGQIRVEFKRLPWEDKGSAGHIDIDRLSSGEKAAIALAMPFLEKLIQARIEGLETNSVQEQEEATPEVVYVIDEPDQHLHPLLERALLDYFRTQVNAISAQFIMATHSPALIDAATAEELYILAEASDWDNPDNQLVRVSDSEEKLAAIRAVAGTTTFATFCKPIVCIEGELADRSPNVVTDQKLLGILCPRLAGKAVLLPRHGKVEVMRTVDDLRAALPTGIPGLQVHGIVDADSDEMGKVPDHPGVFQWPFCMLENLLLHSGAIFELLQPYADRTGLASEAAVGSALKAIVNSLREEEVKIRVFRSIGTGRWEIAGANADEMKKSRDDQLQKLDQTMPTDGKIERAFQEAETEVAEIMSTGTELARFRGKQILRHFHKQHAQQAFPNERTFEIELALRVATRPEVLAPLEEFAKVVLGEE